MKIGLTLLAVAENVQPSLILSQLHHKIENVSVAVMLPEDRDKTEYAGLNAVTFSVSRNHSLAGELRRPVKRCLHWKGCVLRGRHDRGLTIDRTGRGEGDLPHLIGSHRLEHIECRDGVLLEIFTRVRKPEPHISIRCK